MIVSTHLVIHLYTEDCLVIDASIGGRPRTLSWRRRRGTLVELWC